MSLSDLFEKLGKTIFEAPFDSADAAKKAVELAEIRLLVLEKILQKGQRAAGKLVFPYNLVRIGIRGADGPDAAFLQSEFLKTYFEQEIKNSLSRANYRFPDDLEVEFRLSEQLPETGQEWVVVETDSHPRREPISAPRRTARLVVVRGTGSTPEIVLTKERTNIGRTVEVYQAHGPSRRNDLAFAEENETNATVSREHAHIRYIRETGEYRLYNDHWYKQGQNGASCGLWIIRAGLSQPVPKNARGVKLRTGDEIQLGRALVRFQMK